MSIRTPKLWNAYDEVIGVYPLASKYLGDQRIKSQTRINIYHGYHMEVKLLASELLGECGVFWSHLAAEIEEFKMQLVTTT